MSINLRCFRWVKFGKLNRIAFVGKEHIVHGQGCYMMFIHLETGKSEIYSAYSPENGLGVRCYIGHKSIPVFAFVENDCCPNIFVYTYPEFNRISTLGGNSQNTTNKPKNYFL